jgi:PD-(D/E)XK endonuclease
MTRSIPEINAVGLTTRKALGEAAEAAFLTKATSLGFGVAKTWGDSERYDFIFDSGQMLWRVQVKSSRYFRSCYKVTIRGGHSGIYRRPGRFHRRLYRAGKSVVRDSHFPRRVTRLDVRLSESHSPF